MIPVATPPDAAATLPEPLSPYRHFTRSEWALLRADTPMMLSAREVDRLAGVIERISAEEIENVYLPLSRLLNFHVRAAQRLHAQTSKFLGASAAAPFLIGLAGSVAVGKSTLARVLCALLARWDQHRRVEVVSTDGFLLPNAELTARGLMERKGFPDSFDQPALLAFVAQVKAGEETLSAPVYSHFDYDIIPGARHSFARPDIILLEGLNVLQPARLKAGRPTPFVSDYFDFSIYLDAAPAIIERWYVQRFLRLRETAFRDPAAYFHRFSQLSEDEAESTARRIWREINLPNLSRNIAPTRGRADIVLTKGEDHRIAAVALRRT